MGYFERQFICYCLDSYGYLSINSCIAETAGSISVTLVWRRTQWYPTVKANLLKEFSWHAEIVQPAS